MKIFDWLFQSEKTGTEEKRIIDRPIEDLRGRTGNYRALTTPDSVECEQFPIFGQSHFNLTMRRKLPTRSISTIKNCFVHGESTALFTVNGRRKAVHWRALPELTLGTHAGNYSRFFEGHDGAWRFTPNPALRVSREIPRGILIGSRHSFNYFHFMFDSVARGLLAEETLKDTSTPIVTTAAPKQILEMAEVAFPGRPIIVLEPNELVKFDTLIVPLSSSFSPDDPKLIYRSVLDAPYLPSVHRRLIDSQDETGSGSARIVYIKRPDHRMNDGTIARTIMNQDEVITYMTSIGADVVSPETMTFREQRETFRDADVVIGMAGSAFANTIFCRKGASVILICQNRIVSPEYFGLLFNSLALRYAVVACEPVMGTNPHEAHLSVTVEISQLREAISSLNFDARPRSGAGICSAGN